MRKFLSITLTLLFISSVSFGQFLQKNGNTNDGTIKGQKSYAAPFQSSKSQTAILTYADDAIASNLGTGGTFTTNAFAYFPTSSFSSNVGESIFMLSVGVGAASTITSFEVCIWTDTTGHGATTVMSQTVTGLVDGWNQITLTTPYTLGTSNIFVGYRMTTAGYSISCDNTPAASGFGDMLQNPTTGAITNLGGIGFGDMSIKAHVGSLDPVEAELESIDNDLYILASSTVDIIGTIKNNGSDSIAAYDVVYTINGGTAVAAYTVIPTSPILTGATGSFTHNVTADLSVVGAYDIHVTISNINGGSGDTIAINDTLTKTINSLSQLIQKKVLHEVLTSSTCAPCATANPAIDAVVYNNNETKSTLIKYQVSWPGAGDPYQNQESADRVTYYGTTGVPDFKVDGENTESGTAYTQAKLDAYALAPAIATVSGTATFAGTSMDVNIDFNAIADISGTLVAQIAVIEKQTVLNVGNNGETEFNNVMMKFIPGTSGTAITDFATPYSAQNVTLSQNLTGTNIEWIGDLRVVAWLQDNATKKVYQSEYIDVTSTVADAGITEISTVASGCGLPSSNDITFTVHNGGYVDLTGVVVSYTIGGGTAQTVNVPGTLVVGADETVTVTGVDFSTVGNYDIVATTVVANDGWTANDSKTYQLSNVSPSAIPYAEQFTDQTIGWNIEDLNNDGKTWSYIDATNFGHGDNTAYKSDWNGSMAADDYLYSTCIDLVAGTDYKLGFWYKIGAGYPEQLEVFIGTSATSTAMTQSIVDLGEISNGTYAESSTNFTVSANGTYYIGFHSYSAADMWYTAIDDVSIMINTDIETPTNNNFNIYPNPTTGLVTIEGAKDSQITVYSMIGDVIYENDKASEITTLDLSSYAVGNYIVKIISNDEVNTQKIVLTK